MTSLEKKVLCGKIKTQSDLDKYYSENARELSTRIDKNVTIFGVIEDYQKALNLLKKKNINIEDKFNRDVFTQTLAKIKAIGITNWKSDIPEFKIYRNYFLKEVSKKDEAVAESFRKLLSDEYIQDTNKEIVHMFYEGFSHYVETAVNLHQYTKVTIIQNNRIGNSMFEEMKSKYGGSGTSKDIDNVEEFLNKLIEEILKEKTYAG
jgi:hypothetical protein